MDSPELSVVVPSVNGLGDLEGVLSALEKAGENVPLEVVVVDRLGEEVRGKVRERFPWVRIIETDIETTIPEMRAIAFREVRGRAVAVIEDHVIVPPDWGRRLLDQIDGGADVVGGTVENAATGTLLDWAAFLGEYSHCMPPLPEGPAEWLTGNNIAYRADLLKKYQPVADEGKWENYLHDRMKADGVVLLCRPEITIGHKKHYTFGEYLSQRYLYARSYAGARVRGAPFVKRLLYGGAAFLLPPILFYRTIRRVLGKGGHGARLLKSLPMIAVFVSSWGLGEIAGYWFGAGKSLSKVC